MPYVSVSPVRYIKIMSRLLSMKSTQITQTHFFKSLVITLSEMGNRGLFFLLYKRIVVKHVKITSRIILTVPLSFILNFSCPVL